MIYFPKRLDSRISTRLKIILSNTLKANDSDNNDNDQVKILFGIIIYN